MARPLRGPPVHLTQERFAMRSLLFALIPFVAIACSKDKPSPTSPASKVIATADAPTAPINLRIEALTDTSAKVAWDAVEGATDYDLNYRTLSGRWTNWPIRGARRAYATIYRLEPETEYRWAVRAENSDGPSRWVFGDNFTTLSTSSSIDTLETFDIELIFANSVPQIDRETFRRAANHIEQIILNDLPDVVLPSTYHTAPLVYKGRQVDDLLILVRSKPERPGVRFGVEAYAESLHERFGRVTYGENSHQILRDDFRDSYQYATQEELIEQQMYEVFVHEILHLLGIGISKEWFEQIRHRNTWVNPPPQHKFYTFYQFNFFYTGTQALAGFAQIKRSLRVHDRFARDVLYHGDYIPVNDDRHHWLPIPETNLDILTGTRHRDENGHLVPHYVSPITRGALRDIGYQVAEVDSIRINATKLVLPVAGKRQANNRVFTCTTGMF